MILLTFFYFCFLLFARQLLLSEKLTMFLFSLTAVVVSLLRLSVAVVDVASYRCQSALDCSLNGECDMLTGNCVCDPAWRGSDQCDVFSFSPTPISSGYHNPEQASWGGNVVYADGKYHMFVAQFANSCPLGYWGQASTIVRVESDSPLGPFTYQELVVPAFSHNPTIRQGPDGAYYLFMIGDGTSTDVPDCTANDTTVRQKRSLLDKSRGESFATSIYVTRSDSVHGPWSPLRSVEFTDSSSDMLCGGYTNPSPHFNPDGSVHLAFQAQPCDPPEHQHWALVGVAFAAAWDAPFSLVSPDPVTPHNYSKYHPVCVAGIDEDPFLWRSERGFHLLTHGMCPSGVRQAHYKFSEDGVTWRTSPRQTYHYTVQYTDDTHHTFARVERPQMFFQQHDEKTGFYSSPLVLYNGVCGTGEGGSDFECVFDELTGMTWSLVRPFATS